MNFLVKKAWNPYLTGILMGVLAVSTFYIADKPMGFAKVFAQATVIIENIIAPEYVQKNLNIQNSLPVRGDGLEINWHLMLFTGLLIGAFISSKLSGEFKRETVPIVWKKRFGNSKIKRLTTAYAGGILLFTGTWIAGGCTMSHGINGSMQLALSGWVFFMVVFAAGILTAMIMYRRIK